MNKHNSGTITNNTNNTSTHNWRKILTIIFTFLLFILTLILNFFQSTKPISNLFPKSIGAISNVYYTEITPAGWTFSIWGLIYTWQALWLIYSIVCIFRKSSALKGYLYIWPDNLPLIFFIIYSLGLCLNIIWLFLWSYEYIGSAFLCLVLLTFTLYACLFISYKRLNKNEELMIKKNLKTDIWLIRLFVQNGIGFYATWCTIASHLNFVSFITYRLNANLQDASTAALVLLACFVVAYFVLENFVWSKYLEFTISPYAVLIFAFTGILVKNWKYNPTRNNIICAFLMALIVLFFILKIVIVLALRSYRRNRGMTSIPQGEMHTIHSSFI